MRKATTPKVSRFHIAVELAAEALQGTLSNMRIFALQAIDKKHDHDVYEAINLMEVAIDQAILMGKKVYEDYDDTIGGFSRIGSLLNAINRLCGERQDAIGRCAQSAATYADAFLRLVETAYDETEWGPNAE